jgi:hypothetical protein
VLLQACNGTAFFFLFSFFLSSLVHQVTASSTDSDISTFNYWSCFKVCSMLCHVSRDKKGSESASGILNDKWLGLSVKLLGTMIHIKCLFSWLYNPLWLDLHSPVTGFSLLVFEVS